MSNLCLLVSMRGFLLCDVLFWVAARSRITRLGVEMFGGIALMTGDSDWCGCGWKTCTKKTCGEISAHTSGFSAHTSGRALLR